MVDAMPYRWSVRSRITPAQACDGRTLTFAVEYDDGGSTLLVTTNLALPHDWLVGDTRAVTPPIVADAIRRALDKGWRYSEKGSAFELTIRLD